MIRLRSISSHVAVLLGGGWYLALLLILCWGCSKSRLEMVPVSGRITMDGGPLPVPGMIWFAPIEIPEGLPQRPAAGKFDTDGEFSVRSFRPGDGLIPGKYRVWIQCLKEPVSAALPRGVSYIAEDYEWPELLIERGATEAVEVNYDVPANPKYLGQQPRNAPGPLGGMQVPRGASR